MLVSNFVILKVCHSPSVLSASVAYMVHHNCQSWEERNLEKGKSPEGQDWAEQKGYVKDYPGYAGTMLAPTYWC